MKKVRYLLDRDILVGIDNNGFELVLSSADFRLREQGPVLYKSHDQSFSIDPEEGELFAFIHKERYLEFPLVRDIGGEIEDDSLEREEAALDGLRLFEVVVFELAIHSCKVNIKGLSLPHPREKEQRLKQGRNIHCGALNPSHLCVVKSKHPYPDPVSWKANVQTH